MCFSLTTSRPSSTVVSHQDYNTLNQELVKFGDYQNVKDHIITCCMKSRAAWKSQVVKFTKDLRKLKHNLELNKILSPSSSYGQRHLLEINENNKISIDTTHLTYR